MGANTELINYVQRLLGYCLTGLSTEQCLFIFYGSGANGKSTLLNALHELLGDYALQSPSSALMTKSGNAVPNDIARMRGARFIATSEIEEGQRFAESLLKQLTGCDTLTARFLFAEYFEFKPTFKILLAANHKPLIKGDDHAIWRRIRLIPFLVTVPSAEQDHDLAEKLRSEFPGILNWLIAGCLKWQEQGLNPPAEVLDATDQYHDEMDTLTQWIGECCVTEPDATAKASLLFASYQVFQQENGSSTLSHHEFSSRLQSRGFIRKKKPSGYYYFGIGLGHANTLNFAVPPATISEP